MVQLDWVRMERRHRSVADHDPYPDPDSHANPYSDPHANADPHPYSDDPHANADPNSHAHP